MSNYESKNKYMSVKIQAYKEGLDHLVLQGAANTLL